MLELISIKGDTLMKKFIIFLSILLAGLTAFLIYLVGWPYLKEFIDSRSSNMANINAVKGNYIGGAVILQENTASLGNQTNENSTNETDNESSKKLSEIVSNMTQDEIELYNISFTGYEGPNMTGQMVKVLLEEVNRSNNYNIGKPGLFVAVSQNYIDRLPDLLGSPGDTENDYSNVSKANSKIMDLRDETDSKGKYNIECKYDSGLVVEVSITEEN